jgi:hypothetical protein
VDRLCLVKRSQAASTDPDFASLALLIYGRLLDVHFELAFGMSHRVADIMTKLRALAADLTFCHWMSASISQLDNKPSDNRPKTYSYLISQ